MAKFCSHRGTLRGPFSKPRKSAPYPSQGRIHLLADGIIQELHRSGDLLGRAVVLATAAYLSSGTRWCATSIALETAIGFLFGARS